MAEKKLHSTIYIDKDIFNCISICSKKLNTSKTKIIKYLLNKMYNNLKDIEKVNTLIQYQRHKPENGFVLFHYKLNSDENKKFKHIQHITCKSLSLLLFIGYILFFKKFLSKSQDKSLKEQIYLIIYDNIFNKNILFIKNEYNVKFEFT